MLRLMGKILYGIYGTILYLGNAENLSTSSMTKPVVKAADLNPRTTLLVL